MDADVDETGTGHLYGLAIANERVPFILPFPLGLLALPLSTSSPLT